MSELYHYNLGEKNPSDQYALPEERTTDVFETVGGNTLVSKGNLQSPNYVPSNQGYTLNNDGSAEFQDVVIAGSISVGAGGTIGGFDVGADYIRDTGNSMGLTSTVTGGDDVRFWAGDTYANRASANFRVTESGAVTADSITLTSAGALLEGTVIVNAPLTITFTAGETIVANNAVSISDGTTTVDLTTVAGNSNALIFGTGNNATDEGQRIAQSFTVSENLTLSKVVLSLDKNGTPSDNVQVTIQGDSGGSPDGTPIGLSPTLAGGSISSGSFNDYSFTVTASLTASTTYWIVLERTGATHVVNYYKCNANNGGNPYSGGSAKLQSYVPAWAGAFGNATSDIRFILQPLVPAGRVIQSSALSNDLRTKNFIGFAKTSVATLAPVEVVIAGLATLAGLTAGSLYYMSDTLGAISTSVGSTTRKLGIAVSTTKLLITNIW